MRTRTGRLRHVVSSVLMLVLLAAVLPLAGSAQSNGEAARACNGGGFAQMVRSDDGSRFGNVGECVRYVAAGGVLDQDVDGDGIPDGRDNCDGVMNPGQENTDGDGAGNACDLTPNGDADGDGVDNVVDRCEGFDDSADTDGDGLPNNCDLTPNGDTDGDGIDNAVDLTPTGDTDGDGIDNAVDATPNGDTDGDGVDNAVDPTPNGDTDGDGIDNAVDPTPNGDTDGDGVDNAVDPTPNGDTDGDGVDNGADICGAGDDRVDTDRDGTPDACDQTPTGDTDGDGIDNALDPTPNGDTDGDGVDDLSDNCRTISNPGQQDTDGDRTGDACDSTPNGDEIPRFSYNLTYAYDQYPDDGFDEKICGVEITITGVYSPFTIYLTYSNGERVSLRVEAAFALDGSYYRVISGGSALPLGESVIEARASGGGVNLSDSITRTCR